MAISRFILSSNGDFRSFSAFNSWMSQLTKLNSSLITISNLEGTTLEVRGNNTIDSGLSLVYPNSSVIIDGNNGKLTFSGTATLNNIKFKNIDIIINGISTLQSNVSFEKCDITVNVATGFLITGDNITFDNCNISYNYDATSDLSFTSSQLSNVTKACILTSLQSTTEKCSNINFTNCNFTTPYLNHFSFISFLLNYYYQYLYSIEISNNQFTCSDDGVDDKRSVISFASTLLTTSYIPRIINTNITNNICNSEQLILISPTLNGSNEVANSITCVNVNIVNNTCGAICFMVADKKPYIPTAPFILNTNSSLHIEKNNCRIIYSGFSSGFINVGSSIGVNAINSSSNIVTGPVIISENICSWIQTGIRNFGIDSFDVYTFASTTLQIKNNKLSAYDPEYLTSYYNGITAINTAIIVDSVVGG